MNPAEGSDPLPQIARISPMGFLASRKLRRPGRWVFYVAANCADLAEGFFTLPLTARTQPRGRFASRYVREPR